MHGSRWISGNWRLSRPSCYRRARSIASTPSTSPMRTGSSTLPSRKWCIFAASTRLKPHHLPLCQWDWASAQTRPIEGENIMPEAVVVSAVRTPIGRAGKGALKVVRGDDLAAVAIRGAVERVPTLDLALIEDLILGCAFPEGEQGMNLARIVTAL